MGFKSNSMYPYEVYIEQKEGSVKSEARTGMTQPQVKGSLALLAAEEARIVSLGPFRRSVVFLTPRFPTLVLQNYE